MATLVGGLSSEEEALLRVFDKWLDALEEYSESKSSL
jgi:hypothetical protein